MQGLVKATPDSIDKIVDDIHRTMGEFNKCDYARTTLKFSWKKLRKVEYTHYPRLPFWYQYRESLVDHLQALKINASNARKNGDEIWLSEISYTHLLKLASGNRDANPIYIISY